MIVERGRHDELLERDGFYRQIYDLELRDQEEARAAAQEPSRTSCSDRAGKTREHAAAAGGGG